MGKLNGPQLDSLFRAIQSTHQEDTFSDFVAVLHPPLPVSYELDTSGSYTQRLRQFLNLLNLKIAVMDLVLAYKSDLNLAQAGDRPVMHFFKSIEETFELGQSGWRINHELFQTPILLERMPFIARDTVRDSFVELHRQTKGMIVVNGDSRSGLSYFKFFASHLAGKFNDYHLLEIDLKDIDLETPGQVTEIDIALSIASKLGMPGFENTLPVSFKYRNFIAQLGLFLRNNQQERKFLIFIHHFSATVTDTAIDMLESIAKKIYLEHWPCYMVLSGCPQANDWLGDEISLVDFVDIGNGSFTPEDLRVFFLRLHKHLLPDLQGQITEDDFLAETQGVVPPDMLAEHCNVTLVSRHIGNWYKRLKEQLN